MTTSQDPQEYIRRVAGRRGQQDRQVQPGVPDDQSGQPLWILVETGLFGTRQSFAPFHGSRIDGEQLVVLAVSKDQVKDAPNIDQDAHVSESEEDALRQYYSGYLGTAGQTGG